MLPVALGCIWIGNPVFAGMVMLIAIGIAYEWLRLCQATLTLPSVLLFAAPPLAVLLTALGAVFAGFGVLLVCGLVAAALASGSTRLLPFGIPYIGLGAIALVWLRLPPHHGRTDVFVLLLVIWATDIGAYVVGRIVGGPRLAPRISPGKTWSGAAGGLLAAMAVGWLSAFALGAGAQAWQIALLAGLIGCIGQAGDLFESLLKRHFNVKDSGHLIPGHGGLLDRLDAVLVAAPVAALLAYALGRGVMPYP